MRRYSDEELLTISEIQHYSFCPRQWQLITLEQLWHDNHLTALGQILHKRVDQPELSARVGDTITMRRVPLVSYTLGLYGLSDAVELTHVDGDIRFKACALFDTLSTQGHGRRLLSNTSVASLRLTSLTNCSSALRS